MRQRAATFSVALVGLTLLMSACGGGGSATTVKAAGALSVPPGIEVLAQPPSMPVPQHMQEPLGRAQLFVGRKGGPLGDPYLDPSSGNLVLTAVNEEGLATARAAVKSGQIPSVPTEYRLVRHSNQQLDDIGNDVDRMIRAGELPNGEAVHAVSRQAERNRLVIHASSITEPMLQRLVDKHGPDVFAVVQRRGYQIDLLTPAPDAYTSSRG